MFTVYPTGNVFSAVFSLHYPYLFLSSPLQHIFLRNIDLSSILSITDIKHILYQLRPSCYQLYPIYQLPYYGTTIISAHTYRKFWEALLPKFLGKRSFPWKAPLSSGRKFLGSFASLNKIFVEGPFWAFWKPKRLLGSKASS